MTRSQIRSYQLIILSYFTYTQNCWNCLVDRFLIRLNDNSVLANFTLLGHVVVWYTRFTMMLITEGTWKRHVYPYNFRWKRNEFKKQSWVMIETDSLWTNQYVIARKSNIDANEMKLLVFLDFFYTNSLREKHFFSIRAN